MKPFVIFYSFIRLKISICDKQYADKVKNSAEKSSLTTVYSTEFKTWTHFSTYFTEINKIFNLIPKMYFR